MEEKIRWYDRKLILLAACIFILPVGLYGLYKSTILSKNEKIISATALIIVYSIMYNNADVNYATKQSATVQEEQPVVLEPQIGRTIRTRYFDVTVENAIQADEYPINDFESLEAEYGAKYIILNVTVKNIDGESRFLNDGNLIIIDSNNKKYLFDKSELVLTDDGWGLSQQLNPLLSVNANVAFKIPEEITGSVFYKPARSKEEIYIGDI